MLRILNISIGLVWILALIAVQPVRAQELNEWLEQGKDFMKTSGRLAAQYGAQAARFTSDGLQHAANMLDAVSTDAPDNSQKPTARYFSYTYSSRTVDPQTVQKFITGTCVAGVVGTGCYCYYLRNQRQIHRVWSRVCQIGTRHIQTITNRLKTCVNSLCFKRRKNSAASSLSLPIVKRKSKAGGWRRKWLGKDD